MPTREMIVFGAGGHAKSALDVIVSDGHWIIRGVFDDNPICKGTSILGHTVAGGRPEALALLGKAPNLAVMVTIGDNAIRKAVATDLKKAGFSFATAVHTRAFVSPSATLGYGSVVMAGGVVNADADVGECVIVNTGTSVDHDAKIGAFVHVAPGAHLCGHVTVGEGALIGAGAVLVPGVTVGKNAVVGAGATVLHDVDPGVTVVGTPAEPIL